MDKSKRIIEDANRFSTFYGLFWVILGAIIWFIDLIAALNNGTYGSGELFAYVISSIVGFAAIYVFLFLMMRLFIWLYQILTFD